MTMTQTTNNTTASATTTTTQQVQSQQQSPFRKIDPVKDLLSIEKEKERSSRREKLLKIKEALLDEGHHFKEGFLDSIGVDKKYSDRIRVEFSVNTDDKFEANAQFDNIRLSKFNSGKLDFDTDRFGWSLTVENTMNLWIKTIFMEAKKWLDYEDSRKVEFLTELSGPDGIIDSHGHFRQELSDKLKIGDELRTNIVITPAIDGDNRLLLSALYKGIPVTGFRSNPFNFLLSDSYGNSVTEKDITNWVNVMMQYIKNIDNTAELIPDTKSSNSNQETIDCYALLNPEDKNGHLKGKDEKYKDFVNRIVGSIYLNNKLTDETHKEYLKFMSDDNIGKSVMYVRLEISRLIGILIKDIHDRYRIYREFGHYWMNAA